jgi:hypothetical protein
MQCIYPEAEILNFKGELFIQIAALHTEELPKNYGKTV